MLSLSLHQLKQFHENLPSSAGQEEESDVKVFRYHSNGHGTRLYKEESRRMFYTSLHNTVSNGQRNHKLNAWPDS